MVPLTISTIKPYYFNLSPTSDATVNPRYLGKRGAQIQGEYRYLNESYSGTNNLEYLSLVKFLVKDIMSY